MSLNDMIEERNIFTLRRKGELTNSSNARAAQEVSRDGRGTLRRDNSSQRDAS